MKRVIFGFAISVLLFVIPILSACNGGEETTTNSTTSNTSSQTTTSQTTTSSTTSTYTSSTSSSTTSETTSTSSTTTTSSTSTQSTTTSSTSTSTTSSTTEEGLTDILGNADVITSCKYDMIITNPEGYTLTNIVWFENNKMRSEMETEGETVITLTDFDARTVYIYYPSQNMAMRVEYEPIETALDETEGIEQYNPEILGTEMLDGKECIVIRYYIEGATTKMWIWKEYGFAIRIEVNDYQGLTVVEYKNISFSDIDDSVFELPDGVEIMDIPGV